MSDIQHVLLVGGPLHFRTLVLAKDDSRYDILFPRPLKASTWSMEPSFTPIPHLEVDRYARRTELAVWGQPQGWIFEWVESR